jgi:hypothetical protein
MQSDSGPAEVDVFERHRARLFGIAYRMLGSVEERRTWSRRAGCGGTGSTPPR